MVPQINSAGLKQRSLQLRHTSRRRSSKILWLKSGHCMLNAHKSKIERETQPNCETCQPKETPEHYLLHCSKYEKESEVLFKAIKINLQKKLPIHHHVNNE